MSRDPDRETKLHRRLKDLGELKAPPAILSTVMSSVRWRRSPAGISWWRWTSAARFAYIAYWLAAAAALAWTGSQALNHLLSGPADRLAPLGRAALVACGALRMPMLAALLFSYLTCAGLGTAFFRLAAGKRD